MQGAEYRPSAARAPAPAGGLPPFCSAPTLFAVMVVAEMVALVLVLAPLPVADAEPWLERLGVVSLYVQWLALLNAVVLCSLRASLQPLATTTGLAIAWAVSVAVTALASLLVCRIDQALGLGLSATPEQTARFVLSNALIAALLAVVLLRYLYVLEQWRGRVEAASKAQVEALQARIRPHFLFNSMNTIASLIRHRPQEAERSVLDLADLFRAALGNDGQPATLASEMELIAHYLRIEQLRLGERLTVELDAADAPGEFALPRLLLQPLVENAIYHGIEPRAAGGTLALRVRRHAEGIEIRVTNPLPEGTPTPRNRMALANVRARIGYHFGVHGTLEVAQGAGLYTATVRLAGKMLR
ncbi:sensor histidine kinase [Dokdonella sp.]|uniref:sensor histidine kinase n=1 Tax=Dokdonella sp. TaxID=2291710 RepID=UPI0031BC0FB7|nr:sensor histidine kinase [Dokdonella sp.]